MRVFSAVVASVCCLTASPARSETNAILAIITDAADRFCNVVPVGGERQAVQVAADVKVEINGLLKKLAGLGVSGTGKYTSEHYVGVLQQDLAATLKDNATCKLKVFMTLQEKLLPSGAATGWQMSSAQAEALRLRLTPIFPKPPIFIKCRTMAPDCERFAYVVYDVLRGAAWPVSEPMTQRGGNVMMTGELGIMVISTSASARKLKAALQAGDVGGLPAELDGQGNDQNILINIGDRP